MIMREFSVHPKPQNNNAKYLFFGLLGSALLLLVLTFYIDQYRGALAIIPFIFLIAALFVYTKYIGIDYYYDIMEGSDGVPLLVVRQKTGKRSTAMCRMELPDLKAVKKIEKNVTKSTKQDSGVKKYSYMPTLMPETYYELYFESEYERAVICVEITDEFANMLLSYKGYDRTDEE